MRPAESELQTTMELRAMASEIAVPKLDLDATTKKTIYIDILKRICKRILTSARIEKIS